MNHNKQGEIATLLTLGLVIVGTVITLGASLFISNKKANLALNSKAETQCAFGDWDCAAIGANNETGRICANMGKSFCAPGDGRTEPGNPNNVCTPNKWDTTWGCWGSPSSANTPGTPDSSPATGNSCSLTQSQYGSCPDSVAENGCYQRLDPPGDPDYGKWFKCVNRWWNGPCDSKEACDGVAAPPSDSAPVVPINRDRLSGCYNFSSSQNCQTLCVSGRPGVDPAQEWYCSDNWQGQSRTPGQYCCPETAVPPLAEPPPADAPPEGIVPGTLGGACIINYSSYYSYSSCYAKLKCEKGVCVENTVSSTPRPTRIPTPSPTAGPSSTPGPSSIPTPNPILTPIFIVEGQCNASGTSIGFGGCSYFENIGRQNCSNSTPILNSNGCVIYRVCGSNTGDDCKYNCYENGKNKNCLGAGDPQINYDYIRIINSSRADIVIGKIIIEKQRRLGGNPIRELSGTTLAPGVSYSINLNNISFTCDAISFNSMKVYLFNPDESLLVSGSDGCWGGVNILINLT